MPFVTKLTGIISFYNIYIGASLVSVGMFSASFLINSVTWQIVFPFTTVRTCVDIIDIVDVIDYTMWILDIVDKGHLDGVSPVLLQPCEGCPLYAAPQRRHLHVPVTARDLTNHR